MPDVNTGGVDFADIAGVLGGLAGTIGSSIPDSKNPKAITTGNVLKAALGNPQVMGFILGLFSHLGGLFKKHPKEIAVAPAPTPTIPVVPVPVNVTPTPTPLGKRKVQSLRSKWYFFERTEKGSQVLRKDEYDAILAGTSFLTRGDRLHIDITPVDASNVAMQPGDAENEILLLQDPTKGDNEGNHRFDYVAVVDGKEYHSGDTVPGQTWDGQDVVFLTSEYDDLGCTPVMTVNRDLELGSQHTVSFYAVYTAPDGSKVTGPKTPQVIVKPWQKS